MIERRSRAEVDNALAEHGKMVWTTLIEPDGREGILAAEVCALRRGMEELAYQFRQRSRAASAEDEDQVAHEMRRAADELDNLRVGA